MFLSDHDPNLERKFTQLCHLIEGSYFLAHELAVEKSTRFERSGLFELRNLICALFVQFFFHECEGHMH